MARTDFTTPRRMSGSAFAVLFAKNLKNLLGPFIIAVVAGHTGSSPRSLAQKFSVFLLAIAAYAAVAAVMAFVSYYFRKYYVLDGNLIFIHGFLHRQTTSIPLAKIQSLRTRQGLIYRLFDMRGITFDTLGTDIELILDDRDWEQLLSRVNEEEGAQDDIQENIRETDIKISNLNLVRGALCQNHLKGMAILLTALAAVYDKVSQISGRAVQYITEYLFSTGSAMSAGAIIICIIILYITVALLWTGKVFLSSYDMRINMDRERLFFESGLFSRNSSRFSYDKICTVYVKQNVLEKLFRCNTVMLRQAANATDDKEGVKIYGSDSAPVFLGWWLGEDYGSRPVTASALSGYGLIGHALRFSAPISVIAAGVLYFYGMYPWIALPAAYLLLSAVKGYLASRRSGIILRDNYIEIRGGSIASVSNFLKYDNVETVRLKASPFTRYFHRVSIQISTKGTDFTVRSLREEQAREICELMLAVR